MKPSASMREGGAAMVLPPALADLIERVIRGTRLWRSEKQDVRAELESHFREGLEALASEGIPLETSVRVLCESFGNPELTAKLIRRGKLRGRPMIWKITIAATIAAFGMCVAGGSYVAYMTLAKPNPSIDYLKQLNEPSEQIAEEQRAWPILRDTLLRFKPMPEELSTKNPATFKPDSEHWAAVREWIELNRPLLPELREAADRPYYGFIYGGSDTGEFLRRLAESRNDTSAIEAAAVEPDPLAPKLISILLPHLAEVRKVAWFLVFDARDHAAAGRHESAWASLDIAHRVAFKVFEGKTLIEQLVGVASHRLATEEMRRMLTEYGDALSPQLYADILSSHLFAMREDLIQPHIDGELLMFRDIVQYVFTDDGKGDGRLIPSQYSKVMSLGISPNEPTSFYSMFGEEGGLVAMAARHAGRIETLDKYEELWAGMERYRRLPLYDPNRKRADALLMNLQQGENGLRFALVHQLLPSLNYADQIIRECAMENAATRTAVLIAMHHAERGYWPSGLSELDAARLGDSPVDVYDGAPLKYMFGDDGRPVVYSVYRNMKDDKGSVELITDESRGDKSQKVPADRVFFPMPRD